MKLMTKFSIIIFFILYTTCNSQVPLDSNILNLLDSELVKNNMDRSDLWLPVSPTIDVSHSLRNMDSLSNDVLKTYNLLSLYTKTAPNLLINNIQELAAQISGQLQIKPFKIYNFNTTLPRDYLESKLSIKIDVNKDLISSQVLMQYLSPIVLAIDELEKDNFLKNTKELSFLIQKSDSLLLFTEKKSYGNFFDEKSEEAKIYKLAKEFFEKAKIINQTNIYSVGISLYSSLHEINQLTQKNLKLYKDSIKTKILDTDYGKIAIGGNGDDNYHGNFLFILDIGGNDTYVETSLSKNQLILSTVRSIIDLSGNDAYVGGDYSYGGAAFGINLLLDYGGNDSYSAGNFSLGCGLFGFGLLRDFGGSDLYSGRNFTQGAAAFGIGLLLDEDGNDIYKCQALSQGFGLTRGFGALYDLSGNDSYISSSPFLDSSHYDSHFTSFTQGASLGFKPLAAGGIGILSDLKGNDNYISDVYSQGCSYWHGIGALFDGSGDDRYQAYEYSQGAAVHHGIAALWDNSGGDIYISQQYSQSYGKDFSFASLIDISGNDHYFSESSQNDECDLNSITLFMDISGNDSYPGKSISVSTSEMDCNDNFNNINIFIDGDGNDKYGETLPESKNITQTVREKFREDNLEEEAFLTIRKNTNNGNQIEIPLSDSIERLFIQASALERQYKGNTRNAQEKIIAMGTKQLPFLLSKLNTDDVGEQKALSNILSGIYDKDSITLKKILIDSLSSRNFVSVNIISKILGEKKAKECLTKFVGMLSEKDWRYRSVAAEQIGNIGNKDFTKELEFALSDEHPLVRANAAYSFCRLFPDNLIDILKIILEDKKYIVRIAGIKGLIQNKPLPTSIITNCFNDTISLRTKQMLSYAIPVLDTNEKAVKEFRKYIVRQPVEIRKITYQSIIKSNNEFWKSCLDYFYQKETETELKELLEKR